MGARAWIAEHWRTSVPLNLPELSALAIAAEGAGAGERHADPALDHAARRVIRARDKRVRAVQRASR